jgi:hypothetical protein
LAEQDNTILEGHVQRLVTDKTITDRRLQGLETDNTVLKVRVALLEKNDSATEHNDTTTETASLSVRSTPQVITGQREIQPGYTCGMSGLYPVKLHPMLPGVLFMVDAEKGRLSDGSEFHLSVVSTVRTSLAELMADESIDTTRLAQVHNVSAALLTAKGKCLQRYLQKSRIGQNKSVWIKDYEHSYACRACVNKHSLCMSIAHGHILVLPLHPLFRTPSNDQQILSRSRPDKDKLDEGTSPNEL